MGRTVSFSISQRSATCAGVLPYRSPISRSNAMIGSSARQTPPRNGFAKRLRPLGRWAEVYLPVSAPLASGW